MYSVGYNPIMETEIEIYETSSGKKPFGDWFDNIREIHTRAKILTRLDRLSWGILETVKQLEMVSVSLGFTMDQGLEFITHG